MSSDILRSRLRAQELNYTREQDKIAIKSIRYLLRAVYGKREKNLCLFDADVHFCMQGIFERIWKARGGTKTTERGKY